MKKIISILLLLAMAISLFACGNTPELVKLDLPNVSAVNCVRLSGAVVDKEAFVEAYNASTVIRATNEDDAQTTDVIVFVLSGDRGVFTLYYIGDDCFIVTGTGVETEYVIKSADLAKLYLDVVDPQPEFIKLEEVSKIMITKAPEKTLDIDTVIKYYNESEFVGKAKNETSAEVILLTLGDGEKLLLLTYLEEGLFRISGTDCKIDYIIKSADLEKLYTDALK